MPRRNIKRIILRVLTYVLALLFLGFAGITHLNAPNAFTGFFPYFVSDTVALFLIYLSGIVEIILAIGLLIPKFRQQSALLIILMLLVYLPLRIRDLFIDNPVLGSKTAALIRIVLQFVLIYIVWLIKKEPNQVTLKTS